MHIQRYCYYAISISISIILIRQNYYSCFRSEVVRSSNVPNYFLNGNSVVMFVLATNTNYTFDIILITDVTVDRVTYLSD